VAVVADRAYKGLRAQLARNGVKLDIKQPPRQPAGPPRRFVPIRPLVKVEHAFAELGRYRRLSEARRSEASALAWVEIAAVGYLLSRLRRR